MQPIKRTAQYYLGLSEASRLNRIHANEYRRYKYALSKQAEREKKQLQKRLSVQDQIEKRDRRNAVIDELTALANYIYTNPNTGKETLLLKHYVKTAIEDAISGTRTQDKERRLQARAQPLTQEQLKHHLYYDPEEGTFEWQTGSLAGKRAGRVVMPPTKPPSKHTKHTKQPNAKDKSKLPRKPARLSGYHIVSEEAYLTAQAQAQAQAQNQKGHQTDIYRLFYAKKAPQGATDELIRVPYYLKKNNPYVRIVLLGKEYTANQLAYLYMGAGGDWNYTRGIDNAYRVNTAVAPEGLKLYDHKTNKPRRKPCRDGDPLNLKWDNIKPDAVSTATITKDPTLKKQVRARACKRVYGHTRNIKHIKGQWVVQGVVERGKIPDFYAWSEADAIREFEKRVAKLKGFKQKLRNGDILVTKKQVSK